MSNFNNKQIIIAVVTVFIMYWLLTGSTSSNQYSQPAQGYNKCGDESYNAYTLGRIGWLLCMSNVSVQQDVESGRK